MSDRQATDRKGLLWKFQGLLLRREAESVRDQVEALVEQEGEEGQEPEADALDANERIILGNVLKLRNKTAVDVMVPRADIIGMPCDLTLDESIRLIQREGHSRFPVYSGDLDDIRGMIHIKDVFAAVGRDEEPFSLDKVLRPLLFVVPQVPVLDLLLQMREGRTHMALVVDEYGGIDGLVTIEDLVETIVGDISDEHDEEVSPQMVERPDGSLDVNARMKIEDFEARMGGEVLTAEERQQDIDTLGGLVFTLAGRVPARGELVSHSSGLEFRVLEADPRRIRRLRVRRPAPAPSVEGSGEAAGGPPLLLEAPRSGAPGAHPSSRAAE
ncbi:hemolysin family protein [Pararoseomonas indoligenes]|uniref:HlyC/CorC family transporter n=1 Tax=Roseomonas indoligenes TaxID=2820811 RepID=A0A940S8T7_9PROT|nr:hemolysin family protein [Pararoseomonas indoligenes]MBP0496439.1 HlyC/CorC family transporter [Pararoseomonas indoligenes]